MALPEMAPHMAVELIETKRDEVVQPTITVTVVSTPPMVQPMIMAEAPIPEPVRVEPALTYIDENLRIGRKSYKSSIVEHYKWTIGLLPRPEDEYQKNKVDPRIAWGSSNHDH